MAHFTDTFALVRCLNLAAHGNNNDPHVMISVADIHIRKDFAGNRPLEQVVLDDLYCNPFKSVFVNGEEVLPRTIAYRQVTETEFESAEWEACHPGNNYIVGNTNDQFTQDLERPLPAKVFNPLRFGSLKFPRDSKVYNLFVMPEAPITALAHGAIPVSAEHALNFCVPVYPSQTLISARTGKSLAMIAPNGKVIPLTHPGHYADATDGFWPIRNSGPQILQ